MKDNKIMCGLLALVVAMVIGVVSFPSAQEEPPSSVTNLDALSKPQESTGYSKSVSTDEGDSWSDSLYSYQYVFRNVTCINIGTSDCTPGKETWLYKTNLKTKDVTSVRLK